MLSGFIHLHPIVAQLKHKQSRQGQASDHEGSNHGDWRIFEHVWKATALHNVLGQLAPFSVFWIEVAGQVEQMEAVKQEIRYVA